MLVALLDENWGLKIVHLNHSEYSRASAAVLFLGQSYEESQAWWLTRDQSER